MTAFIGVRISWLIAARNALFGLVRRVGLEPRLLQLDGPLVDPPLERLDVLPELGGHVVERDGERPDLVLGPHPGRRLEVACLDPAGGVGQREDRLRDAPGDERDGEREQQADTSPTRAIVRASWRADPNASSWVISAMSPAPRSGQPAVTPTTGHRGGRRRVPADSPAATSSRRTR